MIGPETYEADGYPHEAWARLRREDPVHWVDRGVINPFWAITKHADIRWISRQPERFLNGPRLAVFPGVGGGDDSGDANLARHLLNMDPPDHGRYRRIASARFTPRAVRALAPGVERIAKDLLDEAAGDGGEREGDFVQRVSAPLPLAVLADVLGVPREDWRTLFRWTNQIAGAADPEFQQPGDAPVDTVARARNELFGYFIAMVEERRERPTDDVTSLIANAHLDDAHLPALELLSYYFLIVVAGNETTRNAMSGGLLALIENPDQLARLKADAGLVNHAVEEIVRWTTPVIQFCRTAAEDCELRGRKIRAGQSLCLFYPSANRDEEVFRDPFAFRIDRHPNRHIAFGVGEHFCLGANLARLELRIFFRQLAERIESVELAGPVDRLRSSFLGGVKRMPIRYRLRPARA